MRSLESVGILQGNCLRLVKLEDNQASSSGQIVLCYIQFDIIDMVHCYDSDSPMKRLFTSYYINFLKLYYHCIYSTLNLQIFVFNCKIGILRICKYKVRLSMHMRMVCRY